MDSTEADTNQKPITRRDALANRQQLLASAKELFSAQGVEATSMYEIAKAAGVGQGTLYRHFADKSAICQALIDEDIQAFKDRVGTVLKGTWAVASPLARIELLIQEKLLLTDSHLNLLSAIDHIGRGRKPFRGPLHAWVHAHLSELLQEAIAIDEIRAVDVIFTADAILAANAPHLYAMQRHQLGYSVEQILVATRQLFIEGLRNSAES